MIAINVSVQRTQGSNNATLQKSITVLDESNAEELGNAFAEAEEFMADAKAKYTGKRK